MKCEGHDLILENGQRTLKTCHRYATHGAMQPGMVLLVYCQRHANDDDRSEPLTGDDRAYYRRQSALPGEGMARDPVTGQECH